MNITPTKPASGYAIRHAFCYAAREMLGDKRFGSSHEIRRGEMQFDCSSGSEPKLTYYYGDSVRISNDEGRSVRLSLVGIVDEQLYEQFVIHADDVPREQEYDFLLEFEKELTLLISRINQRLELWLTAQNSTQDSAA